MKRATRLLILLSVLALVCRLILIDQPYIDNWSWRQSDVAAIARNYYQNGFHFVYPQIDWAGDRPGYVGTEFPILPFLAALAYKIFGVHDWIGRTESVILFVLSLPFFFVIVRKIFGQGEAVYALFFYSLAPLSIVASRAFMPDMPSLSLGLIGLYFFLQWIENESSIALFAAAIAISIALLIKLPNAVIGAPLLYLAWEKFRWGVFRQPALWIFAAIALIPSALWYWHAPEIAERFYPYHFFGDGGFRIMDANWYWKIMKQTATSSLTPILFALASVGAFVVPARKFSRLFHWWFVAMVAFIYLVGWGNRHQWYQLPLVPIASAFGGAACAFIASKMLRPRLGRIAILTLIVSWFPVLSYVYARRICYPTATDSRDMGLELRKLTPGNSLIVAADSGDPTALYYAERKGWHFLENFGSNPVDSREAIMGLEKLRRRVATHFVLCSVAFWWFGYYK